MTAAPITAESLRNTRGTLTLHARLSGGSLYVYQSVEHPRLSWSVTNNTRKRTRTVAYAVDDVACADLDAVAAALNAPPAPTQKELALDPTELCTDCPPIGYPTDRTRCSTCPRRNTPCLSG